VDDRHVKIDCQDGGPYERAERRGGSDKALDLTDGVEVVAGRVRLVVVDQIVRRAHDIAQGCNEVGDGEVHDHLT